MGFFVALEIAILVPVVVLCLEVFSAITLREKAGAGAEDSLRRSKVGILVPAHNEASIIVETLAAIRPQLLPDDRLLVVADNCSDNTAALAEIGGAEVASRTDMVRRGKGFALDFGLQRLSEHPPDIVIIIDADCRPAPHCINRLAIACKMAGQPIQARYLMHARASAAAPMKIAEFAWLMKNRIRPIGLHRFGFPTHLTGSGMAFPWSVIKNANLASGHIVEDLKLGVDLACAGSPALYCDAASIHSEFPLTAKDSTTQRTRWEHGHLYVILTEAPRMLWIGAKNFDLDLFVLALDLSIPPLVMLIFLIIVEWFVSVAISILSGRAATFEIATLTLAVLTLAIFFAWMRFGRRIVSATELTGGFGYALMKIPVYLKFFIARQVKWVRAKRDGE